MTNQYNVTQRQAIAQYRTANKIGKNVSDAQVVKQMQAKGNLPKCFSSLAQAPKATTKQNSIMTSQNQKASNNKELSALGLKNNKGAGTKIKDKSGNLYTVIGEGANGRKIVRDKNGQTQVVAHDGTLLKKSYVQKTPNGAKPKSASQTTLNSLRRNLNSAKTSFQKQLDDDGWAGDLADGVSALWGSKNRASKVRKDIAAEEDRLRQLTVAAQKGDAGFKAKFKLLYGVDYNQTAIDNYNKKPTAENYKKAYGSKYPDIRNRVKEYNKSQQTGAEVVKTSAKVAAGVAVGVATGGTGLVAMGVAAGATTLASVAIEESDRYRVTSGGGFRKGTNHKKILKSALWDGASVLAGGAVGKVAAKAVTGTTKAAIAGRAAINATGDVAMGAAQEYAETGKVTTTGVLTNAAMSGVGSAISSGALKSLKGKITRNFKKKTTVPDVATNIKTTATSSLNPKVSTTPKIEHSNAEPVAGGFFGDSSSGSMLGKLKSKLGFKTAIEPDLKKKLQNNYLNDVVESVEANGNMRVSQRLKETLNGKQLVTDLDSPAALKNISSHVGNGDVCAVGTGKNQKLYVNDNGTPIELKISREKLEELFPPLETSTFNQPGGTQVCTILSKINTMLDTPKGRTAIYTMLEQDGNDVIVHLRGKDRAPVRFTGGKPANINLKDNGFSMLSGNAQGVEMLEQAVLVDRIRQAEHAVDSSIDMQKPANITDFSVAKIRKQVITQAADNTASIPLVGKAGELKRTPQGIAKTIETEYKSGVDMMTALWEGHARSVVGYDAATRTITYHDPMKGGVDIQEPLETFLSHSGLSINLNKTSSVSTSAGGNINTRVASSANSSPSQLVIEHQNVSEPQLQPEVVQPKTEVTQPKNQEVSTSQFTPRTTDLVQGKTFVVTRTVDGVPIGATVTQSSVVIKKSGKSVAIAIPPKGGYEAVLESSSNTFLIVKTDNNGKISIVTSETPELPNVKQLEPEVVKPKSRFTIGADKHTVQNPSAKPQLEIPAGAKLFDNPVIMGKPRRRIQMSDGTFMVEMNGKWKKM